jgi:hypothetical protein
MDTGIIYLMTSTLTIGLVLSIELLVKPQEESTSEKSKSIPIEGRKNRKRVVSESKWREYTGSCEGLNKEIKELGKEKFTFEVLKLCKTKGELTFSEVEYQIKNDVLTALLEDGNREYYNSNIMSRWFS